MLAFTELQINYIQFSHLQLCIKVFHTQFVGMFITCVNTELNTPSFNGTR